MTFQELNIGDDFSLSPKINQTRLMRVLNCKYDGFPRNSVYLDGMSPGYFTYINPEVEVFKLKKNIGDI